MKIDPHSIRPGDEITVRMTVQSAGALPKHVRVVDSMNGWHFIPPADILTHTPKPRPFAVGDQVIAEGDKAKVLGLDRGWVWLAWHKGGHTTRAVETIRPADEA